MRVAASSVASHPRGVVSETGEWRYNSDHIVARNSRKLLRLCTSLCFTVGSSVLKTTRLLVAEVSLASQVGFRNTASRRMRPACHYVSVISSTRPLLGILAAFTL